MSREMSRSRFSDTRGATDKNAYGHSFEEAALRENDEHIQNITNKAAALKSISIGILGDVKEDNRRLDGMATEFDGANSLLRNTMNQLDSVVNLAKGHKLASLVGIILFVLLIIYYFTRP